MRWGEERSAEMIVIEDIFNLYLTCPSLYTRLQDTHTHTHTRTLIHTHTHTHTHIHTTHHTTIKAK